MKSFKKIICLLGLLIIPITTLTVPVLASSTSNFTLFQSNKFDLNGDKKKENIKITKDGHNDVYITIGNKKEYVDTLKSKGYSKFSIGDLDGDGSSDIMCTLETENCGRLLPYINITYSFKSNKFKVIYSDETDLTNGIQYKFIKQNSKKYYVKCTSKYIKKTYLIDISSQKKHSIGAGYPIYSWSMKDINKDHRLELVVERHILGYNLSDTIAIEDSYYKYNTKSKKWNIINYEVKPSKYKVTISK